MTAATSAAAASALSMTDGGTSVHAPGVTVAVTVPTFPPEMTDDPVFVIPEYASSA